VVVSGYERTSLPIELEAAPFVAKPVSMPLVLEAIETVMTAPERRSPPPLAAAK
jgi:hypothetical protein